MVCYVPFLFALSSTTQISLLIGHTFIDILKMDIEGAEFEVLGSLIDQYRGKPLPFGQLQLEIHLANRTFPEIVNWYVWFTISTGLAVD